MPSVGQVTDFRGDLAGHTSGGAAGASVAERAGHGVAHMKPLPDETQVASVGAGPTGLTLACVLASEGIPFLLLDRAAESANTSRAAVIHARTLEALEALQVTERLHEAGHIVPRFTIRDR